MIFDKEILLEKYIGETSNIKEAQKCVSEICDVIRNSTKDDSAFNIEKANKNLQKALQKEFGFLNIEIGWVMDGVSNASTYITSTAFIDLPVGYINKFMGKTKRQPHKVVYIFMHCGMVTVDGFTDREVMAVLLHEIGHQINLTPYKLLEESLEVLVSPILMISIPLSGMIAANAKMSIGRILQSAFPKISITINNIMSFMNHFKVFGLSTFNIISYLTHTANVLKFPLTVLGYGEERMADKVVADYGYVSDSITAQHKFETHYKTKGYGVLKDIPVIDTVVSLDKITVGLLLSIIDPHPASQTRITQNIKRLKRNLNDPSIPPSLKKEIQKEIKKAEDIYDSQYVKGQADDAHPITLAKRQICQKLFNGNDDPREILAPLYDFLEDE